MQDALVAEIEVHQKAIAQLESAIEDEKQKIQAALARVWGEDEPGPAEA